MVSLEFEAQCWHWCKRNGMQSKAELSQRAATPMQCRCPASLLGPELALVCEGGPQDAAKLRDAPGRGTAARGCNLQERASAVLQ